MKHKYLKNVTTLKYTANKCVGCKRCTEVCPHGVFRIKEKTAYIANKDSCMECGACAMNCPVKAIKVNAGVGCAAAIIFGLVTGKEPTCGCSDNSGSNKMCC